MNAPKVAPLLCVLTRELAMEDCSLLEKLSRPGAGVVGDVSAEALVRLAAAAPKGGTLVAFVPEHMRVRELIATVRRGRKDVQTFIAQFSEDESELISLWERSKARPVTVTKADLWNDLSLRIRVSPKSPPRITTPIVAGVLALGLASLWLFVSTQAPTRPQAEAPPVQPKVPAEVAHPEKAPPEKTAPEKTPPEKTPPLEAEPAPDRGVRELPIDFHADWRSPKLRDKKGLLAKRPRGDARLRLLYPQSGDLSLAKERAKRTLTLLKELDFPVSTIEVTPVAEDRWRVELVLD